jgi:hypothetical protein
MRLSPSSSPALATCDALRDAAVALAECGDPAAWIGAAHPIVLKAAEQRCRDTQVDPDAIVTAFLDERLLAPALVKGVARADNPVAYLKSAVGRFVLDELREVAPRHVPLEELEVPSEDEQPEELEHEPAHASALARVAELPMRDRVLLRAQLAGLSALGPDERAWIAARRGVSLDQLEVEIDAETARVEAMKQARVGRMNARLAPSEATPRRLSRSIGFVPAGPLGLGGGVRGARCGGCA